MNPEPFAGNLSGMNTSRRRALALPAGALALATLALAANTLAAVHAAAASAHQPAAPSPGWRLSKTISIRDGQALMTGIDAVSDDDAWATGTAFTGSGGTAAPLLEHWDGTSWRRVRLPVKVSSSVGQDIVANVGVLSADDVWAITFKGRYLRLHDDRWTTGLLPDTKNRKVVIDSVKTFGPADVWAFGYRSVGRPSRLAFAPYAARFDGRRWTTIPVPGRGILDPASAISANDLWAVVGVPFGVRGVPSTATVLRWNGARWLRVPVQPNLPKHASVVGILAANDSDVWIGGSVPNGKGGTSEMARHWNGKSWTQASPHTAATSQDFYLGSFVTDGRGGFWAIGGNLNLGAQRLWHHSAGRWSAPIRSRWQLYQLAAVPDSTSTWGVGSSADLFTGLIVLHGPVPR
jgi:hypothetical protein